MGCAVSVERDSPPVSQRPTSDGSSASSKSMKLREFTLKQIQVATNGFSEQNIVGKGCFGTVYRAMLPDWTMANDTGGSTNGRKKAFAVKRLEETSFESFADSINEVIHLDNLQHPKLVQLLGYASHSTKERMLIYEFMDGGNLKDRLYNRGEFGMLTWEQRLTVIQDVAECLVYLHQQNVIHRNLKPQNIMLNKAVTVAKVTDFRLAAAGPEGDRTHISTLVIGEGGYLDQEYLLTGKLSKRTDAYAYGVVVMELLSGKPPIGTNGEENLSQLLVLLNNDPLDLESLIDKDLQGKFPGSQARSLLRLVKVCLGPERPSMEQVLQALRRVVSINSTEMGKSGS
eukprot:TRINITY_DN3656_c0_g1_i1.p1 TRINITY_DN3656_c0_g1~~TRINITY_DN3656_c0_g1_i1.p1  ORF type:complete len:343 (-),score=100.51 TRINITY_DN3656_c0_g1_i1:345-1373(-)